MEKWKIRRKTLLFSHNKKEYYWQRLESESLDEIICRWWAIISFSLGIKIIFVYLFNFIWLKDFLIFAFILNVQLRVSIDSSQSCGLS